MLEIRISLDNQASLGIMGLPALGFLGDLPAGLAGPGLYVIYNGRDTRYIGISTDMRDRFIPRLRVVCELGMATNDLAGYWVWWGGVSSRRLPAPPRFAAAFPTMVAGLPLAARYRMPAAGVRVCTAPYQPAPGTVPAAIAAAVGEVATPLFIAGATYRAWGSIAAGGAAGFNAAFAGFANFAPPAGAAGLASMSADATAAATALALHHGVPAAEAHEASNAAHAFATGGAVAVTDVSVAVRTIFGGAALAAPAAGPTAWTHHVPGPVVAGGNTQYVADNYAGIAPIDLERVTIRFVRGHLLAADTFISNGMQVGPLPWPAGATEPICITWYSAAGSRYDATRRSIMWWPNGAL